MGYSGVARSMVGESCRSVDGHDVCGHVAPALSKVACSGSEYGLLGCAHDSKESVFCASEVPKGVLRARLGSALLERTRLLSGLRRTTWCCTALARATRRATRRLRELAHLESIGAARVFVSGKTGDGAWQGERRLVWLQSCRFRGRFLIVWSRGSCRSCVMTLSALFCLLPLASALQPQRMTHRKALCDGAASRRSDECALRVWSGLSCAGSGPGRRGRLCSAEYTQNARTANPDGVAGKVWCAHCTGEPDGTKSTAPPRSTTARCARRRKSATRRRLRSRIGRSCPAISWLRVQSLAEGRV